MKASLILLLLASFLALPIGVETTGSVLFAAGLALVFSADYSRRFRPLATRQRVAPPCRQDLRLAA